MVFGDFLGFHIFQSPGKEPRRPYDQNGGSIALRSLIFDPFAKETVFQKHTFLACYVLKGEGGAGVNTDALTRVIKSQALVR